MTLELIDIGRSDAMCLFQQFTPCINLYQWIPVGGSYLMNEDNVGQDQRYEQFGEFAESCSQCRRIGPTIVRSNSIPNQSTIRQVV